MSFYAIIDHKMCSLIQLTLILANIYGLHVILHERLFLVLFEWVCFKWPFSTGGKQYKKAVGTWSKVTTTAYER